MALSPPPGNPYIDDSGTAHPDAYAVLAIHNNNTVTGRLYAEIWIFHDKAAFVGRAKPVTGGIVAYELGPARQTETETGQVLLPSYADIMGPGPLPPNAEQMSLDDIILFRARALLGLDPRWEGWRVVP